MDNHQKVDFVELQRLGIMCNAVYLSDAATHEYFTDLQRTYGADQVTKVDTPDTHSRFLVIQDPDADRQYVVVRGTANFLNVLSDVNVDVVDDSLAGVPVHEGFMLAALEVAAAAEGLLHPDRAIVLTGHSLGGAVAAILAMEFAAKGRNILSVVTFGQPKVTTDAGVQAWRHLPLLRVVDRLDPVPRVPVHGLHGVAPAVYQHFGREVVLLNRRRYIHRPEDVAELEDAESAWDVVWNQEVSDHYMDSYLSRISACVGKATEVADDPKYK